MKFLVVLFLISLFILPEISSLSIDINVKPSFNIGDNVSFSYTINSDTPQNISYVASVQCPDAPISLLNLINATTGPIAPVSETYLYLSVLKDSLNPQTCTAYVTLLSPVNLSQNKTFSLNMNPNFDFNLNLCNDSSCAVPSRFFITGNQIYLNYTSDLTGLIINATLKSPPGDSNSVSIPGSFYATRAGTYSLDVSASKQGYKTITKEIKFGVIDSIPDIPYTSLATEQTFNTPHSAFPLLPLVIGFVLIAAIITFFVLRHFHKNIKQ